MWQMRIYEYNKDGIEILGLDSQTKLNLNMENKQCEMLYLTLLKRYS